MARFRATKNAWTDDELEVLLSAGSESRRQYDAILARVLTTVDAGDAAPAAGRTSWLGRVSRTVLDSWVGPPRMAWVGAAALAGGALLLALQRPAPAPATSGSQSSVPSGEQARVHTFVAKGDEPGPERPLSGSFEASCNRPDPRSCQRGDTLMFSVHSHNARGYLGAYAEKVPSEGAERIWYFPDVDGQSPYVSEADTTQVLPQGIVIGPQHAPGRYRIVVWLSATPIPSDTLPPPEGKHLLAHDVLFFEVSE